jgi:hypothetical protein
MSMFLKLKLPALAGNIRERYCVTMATVLFRYRTGVVKSFLIMLVFRRLPEQHTDIARLRFVLLMFRT